MARSWYEDDINTFDDGRGEWDIINNMFADEEKDERKGGDASYTIDDLSEVLD